MTAPEPFETHATEAWAFTIGYAIGFVTGAVVAAVVAFSGYDLAAARGHGYRVVETEGPNVE